MRKPSLRIGVVVALVLSLFVAPLAAMPAVAADSVESIPAGSELRGGDAIVSPNGQFRLVMQTDGNLVLYAVGTRVLFTSGTAGSTGARAVPQADGNLVVYDASGRAVFVRYGSTPGGRLAVQDDGNAVFYAASGGAIWATGTSQSDLRAGERLNAGWSITSPNGANRLSVQTDGNLVLYNSGRAVWPPAVFSGRGNSAVLQSDGNFVFYGGDGRVLYATYTVDAGATRLSVQNDGNLVLLNASGTVVWSARPIAYAGELPAGTVLRVGDTVTSPSGQFRLQLESTGSLVLRSAGNQIVWSTYTTTGVRAVLQTTGQLQVRTASGGTAWSSGTTGAARRLAVQDDGNLVAYTASNGAVYVSATRLAQLVPGERLLSGHSIRSPLGDTVLTMRPDGDLVLTRNGATVWSSGTRGAGSYAVLQPDGNLVVYTGAVGTGISWKSGSPRNLTVQDGGRIIQFASSGSVMWSSSAMDATTTRIETAIGFAQSQLGEDYASPGNSVSTWDCSGLTLSAFKAAGVTIGTHSSTNQYNTLSTQGRLKPYTERQRGDLIFWGSPGNYYHVSIYLGNGKVLEAPDWGKPVRVRDMWGTPANRVGRVFG